MKDNEIVTAVNKADYTPAEHAAVDAMSIPLIRELKRRKSFRGRRNRDAFKRMDRPEKQDAMERGASFITSFLERAVPKVVKV